VCHVVRQIKKYGRGKALSIDTHHCGEGGGVRRMFHSAFSFLNNIYVLLNMLNSVIKLCSED
jgi:hypothetical protein